MPVYDKVKPFSLLLGITLMVIGIIFLAAPDRVAEFLAIFVGAVITVIGVFRIITVALSWKAILNRGLLLAFGIIMTVIGVFMLFNPEITISMVGAVIGILAIFLALDRFTAANRLKKITNVTPTFISGLIHLAFGIGVIYSAIVVFSIIIVLTGIYLLISGVMFALSALFFRDF